MFKSIWRAGSPKKSSLGIRQEWDLTALLNAADVRSPRPFRHLWLIKLVQWVRSGPLRAEPDSNDESDPTLWPVKRICLMLNTLDRNPEQRAAVATLLSITLRELDDHGLWADFGFAPRSAFMSELSERMRRTVLPMTPDTNDLGVLFRLALNRSEDADWIAVLDEATLQRIAQLLSEDPNSSQIGNWSDTVVDAVHLLASQIRSSGFSALMRQRMDETAHTERPFHALTQAVETLERAVLQRNSDEIEQAIAALYEVLSRCRYYTETIYGHLSEFGISVDVIFEMNQLKERTYRVEALLATISQPQQLMPIAKLLAELVRADQSRRGVRALFAHHYSMLAHKLAQRNGDIGAHYITSSRSEYFAMLRRALIGGAIIAITTFMKFVVVSLGLSLFLTGLLAGINYAASFVVIFLLHGVVATKQPAMTAPALALKLESISDTSETQMQFVTEVAKLIRSQFAGISGNLLAVTPLVLGVQLLAWQLLGAPLIGVDKAQHVLEENSLLGPSLLYAAFTGVILFVGSLMAGWIENWFIWHRLDSAIAWNPRCIDRWGSANAQRYASWWRANISGMSSNITLGLMLGLIPIAGQFFGIPLEVRHVTLVTGQVMAAAGTLGTGVIFQAQFWWCIAAIPLIGIINLSVSFALAFRVALRSRGIQVKDRKRISKAVLRGIARHPLGFIYPAGKFGRGPASSDDV